MIMKDFLNLLNKENLLQKIYVLKDQTTAKPQFLIESNKNTSELIIWRLYLIDSYKYNLNDKLPLSLVYTLYEQKIIDEKLTDMILESFNSGEKIMTVTEEEVKDIGEALLRKIGNYGFLINYAADPLGRFVPYVFGIFKIKKEKD